MSITGELSLILLFLRFTPFKDFILTIFSGKDKNKLLLKRSCVSDSISTMVFGRIFKQLLSRNNLSLVSNWLISKKVDKIYLKDPLNQGPSLIFKNNLTEVIFFDSKSLMEIINKELKKI